MPSISIFWFRRDLRLQDNHGLWNALQSGYPVLPIFIFDRHILDELPEKDARVAFIHNELSGLRDELQMLGSDLKVYYGFPKEVWQQIIKDYQVSSVYTNRDYEPYAQDRDREIEKELAEENIEFHTFKDHVIFEKKEILSNSDTIYTVFTPYKKKWLPKFYDTYQAYLKNKKSRYPSEELKDSFYKCKKSELLPLEEMGFANSDIKIPNRLIQRKIIKNYGNTRNFPADENGTSQLGIHFRFGTISIRHKAIAAARLSDVYLNELIWRDFYAQILANYPHVVTESFRPIYDTIEWRNDKQEFESWQQGLTGYPLVDAGMRQLNTTGYMHNRVRMVVASFLTKHLLIDWRWGEAYFAEKLLDYDLASNNGGWQWAAGSGTDAAPYFRIFNPESQLKKFDSQFEYVKRWITEYGTDDYPQPIVEHRYARERCLETYKNALNNR